jgi:hypothetical protein
MGTTAVRDKIFFTGGTEILACKTSTNKPFFSYNSNLSETILNFGIEGNALWLGGVFFIICRGVIFSLGAYFVWVSIAERDRDARGILLCVRY